ncbi:hypothetical protein UF75_0488 [Desulfosporosinus sp. I2]|nr:hypothetical protein UF75_0488 [Desulfosporosinus sp. I2]
MDDCEHILGLKACGIPRITLDTLLTLTLFTYYIFCFYRSTKCYSALRNSDGFCEHLLTLSPHPPLNSKTKCIGVRISIFSTNALKIRQTFFKKRLPANTPAKITNDNGNIYIHNMFSRSTLPAILSQPNSTNMFRRSKVVLLNHHTIQSLQPAPQAALRL